LLAYFDGTTDAGKYTQLTLQYSTPSVSDEAFLPPNAEPPAAAAAPTRTPAVKATVKPTGKPSPKPSPKPSGTEK
jgi:hypothetical protein